MNAEQLRAHRRRLAAKGICTRCHKREAGKFKQCETCRNYLKTSLVAAKKRWRRSPDKCSECGAKRDCPGLVHCSTCLERHRKIRRRLWHALKDAGRCVRCTAPLAERTHVACGVCGEEENERRVLARSLIVR